MKIAALEGRVRELEKFKARVPWEVKEQMQAEQKAQRKARGRERGEAGKSANLQKSTNSSTLTTEYGGRQPVAKQQKKDYGTGVPQHEVEAIAECLLPAIRAFFESEEGQREFAQWKAQQAEKKGLGMQGTR